MKITPKQAYEAFQALRPDLINLVIHRPHNDCIEGVFLEYEGQEEREYWSKVFIEWEPDRQVRYPEETRWIEDGDIKASYLGNDAMFWNGNKPDPFIFTMKKLIAIVFVPDQKVVRYLDDTSIAWEHCEVKVPVRLL